jgi:hypothetical protein
LLAARQHTQQQAQEIKPPISQARITPDLLQRAEIRSTSPM